MSSELNTWGEIANYLGVGVRTAQAYEKNLGLPVYRLGGKQSRVFAIPQELDAWKARSCAVASQQNAGPDPPPEVLPAPELPPVHKTQLKPVRTRLETFGILALFATACLGMAAYRFLQRPGVPASGLIEAQTLIVKDAGGRTLWSYLLPAPKPADHQLPKWFLAADIDGDGEVEVLAAYEHPGLDGELICLSQDGKSVKWRFHPGQRVLRDGNGEELYPPYEINAYAVVPGRPRGGERIVVSSRHHMEQPNQVVVLDGSGRVVSEYWHPGHLPWLGFADIDGDGKPELLLAGVNNGEHAATLIAFDPDRVSGTPQSLGDPHFALLAIGPSTEKRVLLFPRSCLAMERMHQEPFNQAVDLVMEPSEIYLWVVEGHRSEVPGKILYKLDRNLRPLNAEPSVSYQQAHSQREREHLIDHAYSRAEAEALLANVRCVVGCRP